MKTIAFFNNKDGVGKTSLVYHLTWMLADMGLKVLAADFDPQANLTSMFVEDDELESFWPDGDHPQSIYGALQPILEGTGDVSAPYVKDVGDNIGLIVGDLKLSAYNWRIGWKERSSRNPLADMALPSGRMQPIGYVVMQHAVRLDRPVKAYERWMARIPATYREAVLEEDASGSLSIHKDPHCIATLKHYRSLMPMAQEVRKPMFSLKPADGALGSHVQAVQSCHRDFRALANEIAKRCGVALP